MTAPRPVPARRGDSAPPALHNSGGGPRQVFKTAAVGVVLSGGASSYPYE